MGVVVAGGVIFHASAAIRPTSMKAMILIITSDGVLEVYLPLTDGDRRDMEIHIRGKFARSIALQVKSTTHLAHLFNAYHLSMFFSVPKDRLVSHPNFWYFFGYFDMKV